MTQLPTTALELAKALQTDAYNLRNQLAAANGQINYDRETDQLDANQLRVWLPRYLQGRGQLKGEKRAMVEAMLVQLNSNERPTEGIWVGASKTEKPIQPKPIKTNELAIENERLTNQLNELLETTKKPSNWQIARSVVFLAVSINGVFWQSMHFASLEVQRGMVGAFLKDVSPFGVGIGFEAMALLLTVFSDKETKATWIWLGIFGLVASLMNLTYYGIDTAQSKTDYFTIIVLSLALPFSIVASAHLFISNKQK